MPCYARRTVFFLLLIIILCIVIGVWQFFKPGYHARIVREHAGRVEPDYVFLAKTIHMKSFRGDCGLSKAEVEADLDEFEWLLENRYSYLHLKGIDYKAGLDAIRLSAAKGMSRSTLAYKLHKLITLFGDGHSLIRDPYIETICSGFLPFLVEDCNGQIVAFQPDRSEFVIPDCPVLKTIDGIELSVWLKCGQELATKGSKQLLNYQTVHNLRYIELLRKELGIGEKAEVEVEFESLDGQKRGKKSIQLARERPAYGCWPKTQSGIIKNEIGYLRIAPAMDPSETFLQGIIQNMQDFRKTQGLVIDIRGNEGGSRRPLETLLPFFMDPNEQPQIINISAYKLGVPDIRDYMENRFLFPISSNFYSETEKRQIREFTNNFRPDWVFEKQDFSEWHYCIVRPSQSPGYYRYQKPVIILTDARNFSACDIFLGAFKDRPGVTLIGTASSGGSGCPMKYRLHYSEILVRLSSMISFRPNGQLYDGRGIEPDIICGPVPEDLIGRSDSVLEKAVELLNTQN
ncbi:MAG: hypothetical protein FJ263_11140 [Planctomycetes bacterium]|nr:hypothetical protein [Planctomycetota bacterium]